MALDEHDISKREAAKQKIFDDRLAQRIDELKWLYIELYDNEWMFAELLGQMGMYYNDRINDLKKLDIEREKNPDWYEKNDKLGMMLYVDNFAKNLKGVKRRLPYLEEAGVNVIHLMPFLDTVPGESDGGYAVKDFRKVRPDLGDMEDLSELTAACHRKGMCVCSDFVMNHTSDQHEWAVKARAGDGEYMSRYFFYDNDEIPRQFDETVPQVFPVTAPGNFTWVSEVNHLVMTSFHAYQWDLNYRNPRVFNEMIYNFLYLANHGVDIIRIDAVPYIWKELGTTCRNLPQVHTIVRLMRLITEIVCPGVLLLGEVVMAPELVAPYFGTPEKPECHMLYNVTTMASIWHTVATRDARLLRMQLDTVAGLPKEYIFLNYLRCHDDIGWGLDYGYLSQFGIEEVAHKRYLNDYFLGNAGYSNSRGETYNDDPVTGDARMCGTTASLCGIEKAGYEGDEEGMSRAIDLDVMLHAYMLMQSGIPIIYSGDEIGQVNDYSYKEDPEKADDSRYLHRGKFRWENERKKKNVKTVEGRIFKRLSELEKLRREHDAFLANADVWTVNTADDSVLCVGRYQDGEKIYGVFNFSENEKTAWFDMEGGFRDLIRGELTAMKEMKLGGYEFRLLMEEAMPEA
ncbi:MAG: alpha-amylase family protein [Eubacterium sp.]|nr:alpha-amylase family protein [Eubacterium sp.]